MDLVLVILAVAVAMWGAVVLLRGGLLGGSLAVLLAGSVFGHPFFNLPGGPVPITIDRVLMVLLLIACLAFRRLGRADPKPLRKADFAAAALVAAVLTSALAHDWQFKNSEPLAHAVFYYAMPLALYWVVRQTPLAERGGLVIMGSFAVFGLYLALTALAEWQQLPWLVFPGYIASGEYAEFLGRARGPYLNPAACGVVQAACFCAALTFWHRLPRPGQLALLALSTVYAAGLAATLTRSVWIGAALSLLVLLGASVPAAWRRALLAGSVVVGLVATVMFWDSLLAYKRDKNLGAELTAESARLRPILATVAWNMFLDRPLFGWGFGQYLQENGPYLSDRSSDLPLEKARPFIQHNVLLALLVETGLLGAGLFTMALALWTRDAWRLWRHERRPLWSRQLGLLFLAFLCAYLTNGMFHDVSLMPMMNMLLFFFGGLVTHLSPTAAPIAIPLASGPALDRRAATRMPT